MGPCLGGAVAGLIYKNVFRAPEITTEYIPCSKNEKNVVRSISTVGFE